MKVLFIYPNLMLQTALPNHIAILSACLKQKGHIVKLFDTTFYRTEDKSTDERRVERLQVKPFKFDDANIGLNNGDVYRDFLILLNDFKPDLIAITLIDDTLELALDMLSYQDMPSSQVHKAPVIAGGVSAILAPDKILSNKNIDYVCTGEGERTLVALCEYLSGRCHSITQVLNLGYKRDGKIMYTEKDDVVDINKLPFEDYDIFDQKRLYRPMRGKMVRCIPLNLDRGCPYSCTFCCAPAIKKQLGARYFRMKTVERIEEEIKHHLKLRPDIEFLYFNSESFLVRDLSFLQDFAEMYKQFSIPFWCQANIATITDEKIRIIKKMGCQTMSVGLESGDENYRYNMMNKRFTDQQAIDAFKIIKKYDIPTTINNIIGLPDETRKMIFNTIRLNRRLYQIYDKANPSGLVFQPYKGTKLHDYCLVHGLITEDTKTDTNTGNPTIKNTNINDRELIGLLNTFNMYIKFPVYYYPFIKLAEKHDSILKLLRKRYWHVYG